VAAADTPAQAAAPPPTPVPVPVPVAPVPGPQAAVVRPVSPASLSALRQALAGVGCTLTSTGLGDDGTVYVTGLGGHGTAEDGLRRAAAGAVPGVTIGWSVLPFDGPYCGVLDSLRPLRARQANALGLALRGNVIRLRQNDKIVLEVTMPDFAGLLQIDYLANDGTVQHLVADDGSQRHVMTSDGWKNAGPSHRYAAGEHVVIGQPDPKTGDGGWDVDAPFGVDMIVAVASSEVLFAKTRPATDATGEYLRALRAAFDRPAVRNGRLAGQAVLLETVAR
jgi:serine/threonine-protein kinase